MADRDWTEFCHYCKEPLAIVEEVIDRGQDLNDKATTVTRKLAERADIPAFLVAPSIPRSKEVQAELEALDARKRELEALHPISALTARQIAPQRTNLVRYEPNGWARELLTLHRRHHALCSIAQQRGVEPVHIPRLMDGMATSALWVARNNQLPMRGSPA
jgi:hypothetical protein